MTEVRKRNAEEVGLDDGRKSDAKRIKTTKKALRRTVSILELANQNWQEARTLCIESMIAVLSNMMARVERRVVKCGKEEQRTAKILLAGEPPADEHSEVVPFHEYANSNPSGIVNLVASASPELKKYLEKERSQILVYQNGNNFTM